MKKIKVFLLCAITTSFCWAQNVDWQKCIGGSLLDEACSIIASDSASIIVAGYAASNDGNIVGNHGSDDAVIAKLDTFGGIVWIKSLGGTFGDGFRSVSETFDGGYIAAGWTKSNDGDVSGHHNITFNDVWVVKLDFGGNIQWQHCYGGNYNDFARSIIQTPDSNFVIAGATSSTDGDVLNNTVFGSPATWMLKIDTSGNLIWQKAHGGAGENIFFNVKQTSDGGYIASGRTSASNGDVTGNHGGMWDIWVVKTDSAANLQWQKCLGGSGGELSMGVIQTNDGGYLIAGFSDSQDGDVTNPKGADDGWVVKLSPAGNIQWQKSLGGSSWDYIYSVTEDANNTYIVSGTAGSFDGDITGNIGNYDSWALQLDASGNIIWSKVFGGTQMERCWTHTYMNGSLLMAGYTESDDGNLLLNNGGGDMWLAKVSGEFAYNTISGTLFADLNSNSVYDASDVFLTNKTLVEQNTGRLGFTNHFGKYYISVIDSGNYVTSSSNLNYYAPVPANQASVFIGLNETDSLNDFAFQPLGSINDLFVTLTPVGGFRPGFNVSYYLNYENTGTTTLAATVKIFPDTVLSFISASATPINQTADSVEWNIVTLAPFQSGNLLITFNVDTTALLDSNCITIAVIEPIVGDTTPNNNIATSRDIITGSYDPNDILVNEDTLTTTQLATAPYLDYIIRFQNTGNDTAFTVKILNPIDTNKLELSTIEFVNASHPVNLNWINYQRNMEFKFDNILLPDSNTNEPASHGFVHYRIKPKTTLLAGDSVTNNAYIYFDFNSPVATNTAVTKIVLTTGIAEEAGSRRQLAVYPNPAKGELTVSGLKFESGDVITLSDMLGKPVITKIITQSTVNCKLQTANLGAGMYLLTVKTKEGVTGCKVVVGR